MQSLYNGVTKYLIFALFLINVGPLLKILISSALRFLSTTTVVKIRTSEYR